MDFFSSYLSYVAGTEVPRIYDRWAAISSIGALLEKNVYYHHGPANIYPNLYCVLVGESGTRKSSAIKRMKVIMELAGYNNFSPESTSKEQWFEDLMQQTQSELTLDSILDQDDDTSLITPHFICADEMNNFLGRGNLDFCSTLGELWDFDRSVFRKRLKNSLSITIPNPIISMLCGNTAMSLTLCFPPETIGQGFFSRIIFIHSERTKKKITYPKQTTKETDIEIANELKYIQATCVGETKLTPTAEKLIDKIYQTWSPIEDPRFEAYSTRRLTQLFKLCIIHAAAKREIIITEDTVIYANTVLSAAEFTMPKALGEYGKAKYADVTHKILQFILTSNEPATIKKIYEHVSQDLDKLTALSEILNGLKYAGKVITAENPTTRETCFYPVRKVQENIDADVIDFSYLTPEERNGN